MLAFFTIYLLDFLIPRTKGIRVDILDLYRSIFSPYKANALFRSIPSYSYLLPLPKAE